MAVWFGHTQTLTSISKSVTTVASGIIGLEANLATFMRKVTYYEQFFQRTTPNLPEEVTATASLLFARCYEYRGEIRDELESSLAYVADAGRWVIGLEDWNSKMEKRLAQISELVLLANTLLVEYAVTGHRGAQGAEDALDAYLRHIADSVVLQNGPVKRPTAPSSAVVVKSNKTDPPESVPEMHEDPHLVRSAQIGFERNKPQNKKSLSPVGTESPGMSDTDGELFLVRSSSTSSDNAENTAVSVPSSEQSPPPQQGGDEEDDDVLNPFARAYQPPVSVESSLASLRAESESGSVYYNTFESHQMSALSADGTGGGDREPDNGDEPDSPVSLGEYECLDMDSIPQYVAFKPSALSRKRRLKQQFFGGASTSPSASVESIAQSNPSAQAAVSPLFQSPRGSPRRVVTGVKSAAAHVKDRQRLMDLTYSYDFQREASFNPFASPAMSSIAALTGSTLPSPLELSVRQTVPTVVEEDRVLTIHEQSFGFEGCSHQQQEPSTSSRLPDVPDTRSTPSFSDDEASPPLKETEVNEALLQVVETVVREVNVEAQERTDLSDGEGFYSSSVTLEPDELSAGLTSSDATDELLRLLSEDEPLV